LLLLDALKRAYTLSKQIAWLAVVVDAKDERAVRFYKDFGFEPFRIQRTGCSCEWIRSLSYEGLWTMSV
jgi:hypothetical protein